MSIAPTTRRPSAGPASRTEPAAPERPGWHARLELDYRREPDGRTTGRDRHEGPLRVLASLHPEGPAVCHHVLLHPPGGVVGGDALALALALGRDAHALLTTPGATRFYRSGGRRAVQSLEARLAPGSRLEWLPQETLVHAGADAENRLRFDLASDAEMIGLDLLALGLPAAGAPFVDGRFTQTLELPGVWREHGRIAADDTVLLDSPLGLDGRRVLGLLWFARGSALAPSLVQALLEAAREAADASPLASHAGATAPQASLVLLRVLADRVEPAAALLRDVWARWRGIAWHLQASPPRVWRT